MKSTQKPKPSVLTEAEQDLLFEFDQVDPEFMHYVLEDMNRLGKFTAWKGAEHTERSLWFIKSRVLDHIDKIIQACTTPVIH